MSSSRRLGGGSGNMVQSKADRERQRLITDKCQSLIEVLLKDDDNKYCVDCDAKGPRWASWNLGIFLCIRCAGIHRNLGVHISKVKSVNLDAWTPEHVAYVQKMGNSRARAIYEANLPDDFRRPQTDTALESFIRAKYEHKRYIAKDYVDPGAPPPAFNIDEELKRMKEQKRNKANASATRIISVPELPTNPKPRPTDSLGLKSKARTSTPGLVDLEMVAATEAASGPSTNSAILTGNNKVSNTLDLLVGDLDTDSAPNPTTTTSSQLTNDSSLSLALSDNAATAATNSFDLDLDFTTSAEQAADSSNKVLTKESILSLYSSFSSRSTKATSADFEQIAANQPASDNPTSNKSALDMLISGVSSLDIPSTNRGSAMPPSQLVNDSSSFAFDDNPMPRVPAGGGTTAAKDIDLDFYFSTPPQQPASQQTSQLVDSSSGKVLTKESILSLYSFSSHSANNAGGTNRFQMNK